jgi:hypothetical protein
VDEVGIIVGGGSGVCVGTTVGPATSVAEFPQAVRMAMTQIAKKKCLTRTGLLRRIKNARIIPIAGIMHCLIFGENQKETQLRLFLIALL